MAKKKITDKEFEDLLQEIVLKDSKINVIEAERSKKIAILDSAKILLNKEFDEQAKPFIKERNSALKVASKFAIDNRLSLFGDNKSVDIGSISFGFEDNPPKVIPVIKATDDAMVEQLKSLANGKGNPYLTIKYSLDKSKIADALNNGVQWVSKLFKQTKTENFYVKKRETRIEGVVSND